MTTQPAKPKRRWYQFSLLSLLVLMTAIAIGPGGWVLYEQPQARRQKAAVALLSKSGAQVQTLDIARKKVTDAGVADLQKALPNLTINR